MPPKQLEENIFAIIENVSNHIPRKWANISSISVKTGKSVALPFYNKTREEQDALGEIAEKESENVESKGTRQLNDINDEVRTKKQKKDKAALKSPLAKALKIQNVIKKSEVNKKESVAKNKKRQLDVANESDKMASNDGSKKKKKNLDRVDATAKTDSESKKPFIISKKFKGSKPGYVFKKGIKGTGYYLDESPKPDLLALDALARAKKAGPKKGKGRRKSSGKKNRR